MTDDRIEDPIAEVERLRLALAAHDAAPPASDRALCDGCGEYEDECRCVPPVDERPTCPMCDEPPGTAPACECNPATKTDRVEAWRADMLRSHANDERFPIRDPFYAITRGQIDEAVAIMRELERERDALADTEVDDSLRREWREMRDERDEALAEVDSLRRQRESLQETVARLRGELAEALRLLDTAPLHTPTHSLDGDEGPWVDQREALLARHAKEAVARLRARLAAAEAAASESGPERSPVSDP